MYCTECGNKIKEGDIFCTECGNKLTTEQHPSDIANDSQGQIAFNYKYKRFFAILIVAGIIVTALVGCFNLFVLNAPHKKEGNIVQEEKEPLPGEGQYDKVLASGDGYYLVSKWFENYKEAYTEYGIINQDSTWLIPLSKGNSIARAADGFTPLAESYYDLKFDYVNEGMFIVRRECCIFPESIDFYNYAEDYIANGGCYVINVETGESYSAGAFITKYYDGYCFYLANRFGKIIRMDRDGNTVEFTKNGKIPWGEPSKGLIYINQKFYDVKTAEVKIDLSEYDIVSQGDLKFNDEGHFTFSFKNPAGTRYTATIDTTGEMIDLMT